MSSTVKWSWAKRWPAFREFVQWALGSGFLHNTLGFGLQANGWIMDGFMQVGARDAIGYV